MKIFKGIWEGSRGSGRVWGVLARSGLVKKNKRVREVPERCRMSQSVQDSHGQSGRVPGGPRRVLLYSFYMWVQDGHVRPKRFQEGLR